MEEVTTVPMVVVVDDDAEIRESLGLLLTDEGYQVALADSGYCALAMLRALPEPAVVLFDFLMPHGDGLDLLRAIADDVVLTRRYAYICMAARSRSRLPGELTALMDRLDIRFMAKPFELDELLNAVDDESRRLIALPDTN